MMSSLEIGVLMVLAFACWTASAIAVEAYHRRSDRRSGHDAAREFSKPPSTSYDTSGPSMPRLLGRDVRIETSFDDKRIGKIS